MKWYTTRAILQSFVRRLPEATDLDLAVVGAGPSGLVHAKDQADHEDRAGHRTRGPVEARPVRAERGQCAAMEGTGEIYPGLFVSGMAACGVHGGFRMGPIFGGMLRSGRKAAELIAGSLQKS